MSRCNLDRTVEDTETAITGSCLKQNRSVLDGLESNKAKVTEQIRDKQALLKALVKQGRIKLQSGYAFKEPPEPIPWDGRLEDKIQGMMLGLAIGDALGFPSEGQLPGRRREIAMAKLGQADITDYLPTDYGTGVPSDDTQMAFWTLEHLNEHRALVPELLAERFATGRIYGKGNTINDFKHLWNSGMRPWYRCAVKSAGNGALMRIAPIVIPHINHGLNPSVELWLDTAILSMITHMDGASVAACVAFIKMLWHLLGTDDIPEPDWWLNSYLSTAQAVEADPNYQTRTAKIPYRGLIWQFVWRELQNAKAGNWTTLEAANRWYSGAYLLETVPSVLYILSRYAHDPEQAIIRAVNDTKDNDTHAAIVGAAVGALYGKSGLPARWIEGLSGRTKADDDGRVFEILDRTIKIWGPPYKPAGPAPDPGEYHES